MRKYLRKIIFSIIIVLFLQSCNNGNINQELSSMQFPDNSKLIALSCFNNLLYYQESYDATWNLSSQTWLDQKFDYSTRLSCIASNETEKKKNASSGITLDLKYPIDLEKLYEGNQFIDFFSYYFKLDMQGVKKDFLEISQKAEIKEANKHFFNQNLIGVVFSTKHILRGNFLTIGFFEKEFYQKTILGQKNDGIVPITYPKPMSDGWVASKFPITFTNTKNDTVLSLRGKILLPKPELYPVNLFIENANGQKIIDVGTIIDGNPFERIFTIPVSSFHIAPVSNTLYLNSDRIYCPFDYDISNDDRKLLMVLEGLSEVRNAFDYKSVFSVAVSNKNNNKIRFSIPSDDEWIQSRFPISFASDVNEWKLRLTGKVLLPKPDMYPAHLFLENAEKHKIIDIGTVSNEKLFEIIFDVTEPMFSIGSATRELFLNSDRVVCPEDYGISNDTRQLLLQLGSLEEISGYKDSTLVLQRDDKVNRIEHSFPDIDGWITKRFPVSFLGSGDIWKLRIKGKVLLPKESWYPAHIYFENEKGEKILDAGIVKDNKEFLLEISMSESLLASQSSRVLFLNSDKVYCPYDLALSDDRRELLLVMDEISVVQLP